MSKMDDLRAMREARYEQAAARAKKPMATPPAGLRPTDRPQAEVGAKANGNAGTKLTAPAMEAPEAQLCGHRAISGRTCTREQGHAAKSHRYS